MRDVADFHALQMSTPRFMKEGKDVLAFFHREKYLKRWQIDDLVADLLDDEFLCTLLEASFQIFEVLARQQSQQNSS